MLVGEVIRVAFEEAEVLRDDFHQLYFVALNIHVIDGISLFRILLIVFTKFVHAHHGINGTCHGYHHGNNGGNGSTCYTGFDYELKIIITVDEGVLPLSLFNLSVVNIKRQIRL